MRASRSDTGIAARTRRRAGAAVLVAIASCLALAGASSAQPAPTGIDVSNWQGQIDWLQVGPAGYSFVFAKATEGTTFTDVTYPLNRSGASLTGLRFGAYHFAQPGGASDAAVVASATAQADAFLAVAQPQPGDLLPVLDLERTNGLSVPRLVMWTQAWLGQVVARLGAKPILYASPSFWKQALGDSPVFALAGHRLWIAHWTKATLPILPGAGWGGLGWSFWQWTNCLRVPGIRGCADGNRYNGADLGGVAVSPFPAGAPTSAAPPSVIGTPQTGRLLAALPGDWGGGKPVTFAYQWLRCDAAGSACAPIDGATRQTYTPAGVDVGRALAASVTAQAPGGAAVATSLPTLAVTGAGRGGAAAPVAIAAPAIQGLVQAGQALTASAGSWKGAPTAFAYQWRRCAPDGTACAALAGAAGTTYTITPGDVGSTISLVVTATGRGGSRSATSAPTAPVAAAPVPAPAIGSALAQPGQAGAVTTADQSVTVTWQPGALPVQAPVTLVSSASRLAVRGTAVTLGLGASVPLPWPVDVAYPAAAPELVPGFLPVTGGVWQPVAQLPSPLLPPEQEVGAYRDPAGGLHVLTRRPGRVALFAGGKWGDPRFVAAAPPRLTLLGTIAAAGRPDGTVIVYGRVTLDSQAHLYASIEAPGGRRLMLLSRGSRIGWWVEGGPAKTLQALQLRPGAIPIRIRLRAGLLRGKGPYTLRLTGLDPYGRRGRLAVRVVLPG